MRWFDSDFDYVQELIDTWNKGRKKIRTAYFIIAALLVIAGILTAVFSDRNLCGHPVFRCCPRLL